MLKKIILGATLLLSSQVYADNLNKIFDIELGSQVDETKSNFVSNDKVENRAEYNINFKGFNTVAAYYTPNTHKIYGIMAIKESDTNCESEAELIAGILGKRYGEFDKIDKIVSKVYGISSGSRAIIINCNGLIDKTLSIYLADRELSALDKKEKIEIESAKEANNF